MIFSREPFNPLHKVHLGNNVARELLKQPTSSLAIGDQFKGAGIYAIYYFGDFPEYQPVAQHNKDMACNLPIYVGKAVPSGSRKGGDYVTTEQEPCLYKRLKEHAQSIGAVDNLRHCDFACRYLLVDDIWIPLAESRLIAHFHPLWNAIGGFGIHDPGRGRSQQRLSDWGTLHPGRPFEKNRPAGRSIETIKNAIATHFKRFPFAPNPGIDL